MQTRIESVLIEEGGDCLTVRPVWSNVDRPITGGWEFPLAHRELAERLKRAILAGAVFGPAEIKTDVDGKTYASAYSNVIGRTANADLTRLGF